MFVNNKIKGKRSAKTYRWGRYVNPVFFQKSLVVILLLCSQKHYSQSNTDFKNYLVLGVESAEELAALYLEPLSEGLLYGLTGGWNNTAQVKRKWELDLALIANGSFVPSNKLFKEIDVSSIDNLEIEGGGDIVRVPTILGSEGESVTFIAKLNGEEFVFDSPTGLGLFTANLLPNAFMQASLGLPINTEFSLRFVPRFRVEGVSLGVVGIGLKHELSKTLKKLEKLPISISVFTAFTRLGVNYGFDSSGFVTGVSQSVDAKLNSWLFEVLASTKFRVLNFYGGLGYVEGRSNYQLLGTYIVVTEDETFRFENPFDVRENISDIRASLGTSVKLNRFRINLDYTFQGYNNLALGIHVNLLKGK